MLGKSCHVVAVLTFATLGSCASIFLQFLSIIQNGSGTHYPKKYRENPHLSLDREYVLTDLTNCQRNEENHSILDQDITGNQQDDQAGVTNQKLKGTESQIRQEAIACREKIKGLSSLTYNIEHVRALKELKGSLEILGNKFTAFQKIDEKENSTQTPINKQSGKKQLETSFGNYLPLPVRPKKKRFHNRAGEFASMMQKHYRVQIPVDGVSAKTSKTKSTLKRKKEPHNKPKHPSLPKKQRTEESSHLIENEKKTCIDPTAAQKRNNTTGPNISKCHDNNKNEKIMHATCVTNNQHLNSEDQPSAQEYRWTSPSSKLQSVLKQASKFKEEHLSNSQVLTMLSQQQSTMICHQLSAMVSQQQSTLLSQQQSKMICHQLSAMVSQQQSTLLSQQQSKMICHQLSAMVSQ